MTGSGKQIFLRILADLSTRIVSEDDLGEATRRARAAVLVHGSTAEESFEHARRTTWATDHHSDGDVRRQGLAVNEVFVSDLYETVFSMPGLEEFVVGQHRGLTKEDYAAFEWLLWLVVSSVQMFAELNSVETSGDIDIDGWVESMTRHFELHFEKTGE